MADLIVIAYDDEFKAEEVRLALFRMQKEHLVDLEDAVVVTKAQDGRVRLNQSHNLVAAGAATGSLWGALIGLLFLNPLLGVAAGAGSGALAGYVTDVGVDDNFMRELGETLVPGTSALFLLVRKSTPDKVLPELRRYGGKVLRTSLSTEDEAKLMAALEGEARSLAAQQPEQPLGAPAP
jgi:uncharacterized membrane protein